MRTIANKVGGTRESRNGWLVSCPICDQVCNKSEWSVKCHLAAHVRTKKISPNEAILLRRQLVGRR